jgi:hypothetical protein
MSRRCSAVSLIATGFLILSLILAQGAGADQAASKGSEKLLNLGKIGSKPINVSIWTNQPAGHKFKPGDRVVIYFKADTDCYITALNISAKGDVAVLFPSREHPNNFVKAGEQYSLFGDDSSIRLVMGEGLPEVKTVFYATSEPVSMESLTIPADKPVLQIANTDNQSIDIIAAQIEKASAKPGYNRAVFAIKGEAAGGPGLRLMGPERRSAPYRPESDRPEGLTGVQGVKPEPGR